MRPSQGITLLIFKHVLKWVERTLRLSAGWGMLRGALKLGLFFCRCTCIESLGGVQLRDGSTHLGTVPSMEPNEDTVIFAQVSSCSTGIIIVNVGRYSSCPLGPTVPWVLLNTGDVAEHA